MTYKVTHTATADGNGKLLASILSEFVRNIPADAVVTVETIDAVGQRDTDSWTLSAVWDGNSKPNSGLSYPPGVRASVSTEDALRSNGQARGILTAPQEHQPFYGSGHP